MRTVGLLVALLLLSACASGADPWDTTGWENNQLDYETDFWEPIEEPTPAQPARTAPPAPRQAPRQAPPAAPTWTTPAPGGMPPPPPPPTWSGTTAPAQPGPATPTQPAPRSFPQGTPGVPPPPPPPYELGR